MVLLLLLQLTFVTLLLLLQPLLVVVGGRVVAVVFFFKELCLGISRRGMRMRGELWCHTTHRTAVLARSPTATHALPALPCLCHQGSTRTVIAAAGVVSWIVRSRDNRGGCWWERKQQHDSGCALGARETGRKMRRRPKPRMGAYLAYLWDCGRDNGGW